MPNNNLPNVFMSQGKFKAALIQSKTVTLSSVTQQLDEITIPAYGDIAALQIMLSVTTTGTLTTPATVDNIINQLQVKDNQGAFIMSKVRGVDLTTLDRVLNIGNVRTVPNASNSAVTYSFIVPLNIERKNQYATLQATLDAYSVLAASGATGGTVVIDTIALYFEQTNLQFTERITRFTQTIGSGDLPVTPLLPKNVLITGLLFKIGTESNLTYVNFSSDGSQELQTMPPARYAAIDSTRLTGGHVTGTFDLYVTPFISTDNVQYTLTGAGADTINHLVLTRDLK